MVVSPRLFLSLCLVLPQGGPPKPYVGYLESPKDIAPYFTRTWTVVPVPKENREAARVAVDDAAASYPPRLVQDNASGGVFLAVDLAIDGVRVGGINRADFPVLFLCTGPDAAKQGAVLKRGFHHELMHVCLDSHPNAFPRAAWLALNPEGFRYTSANGLEALRDGASEVVSDEEARRAGFASAYGRASFDEDVATTAEFLMSEEPSSIAGLARYPWLRRKCEIVRDFYAALYPGFKLGELRALEKVAGRTGRR